MVVENLRPFSPIASFSLIDPPCLIKIEAARQGWVDGWTVMGSTILSLPSHRDTE